MPKTVKHGNISIEEDKLQNGRCYRISCNDKGWQTAINLYPEELHSLELCLFKLKGLEITESDKLWEKETKNFNN